MFWGGIDMDRCHWILAFGKLEWGWAKKNVRPTCWQGIAFFGSSHWGRSFPPRAKSFLQIIRTVIHLLHQNSYSKPNATTSICAWNSLSAYFNDTKWALLAFRPIQEAPGWCSERKWRWSLNPRRPLWRVWRTRSRQFGAGMRWFNQQFWDRTLEKSMRKQQVELEPTEASPAKREKGAGPEKKAFSG